MKFSRTQRTRIKRVKRLIEQAEYIGWPALADSLKKDLARVISSPAERFATVNQLKGSQ